MKEKTSEKCKKKRLKKEKRKKRNHVLNRPIEKRYELLSRPNISMDAILFGDRI